MSNDDELFVDGVPLHARPDGVRVDWVGEIYPAKADPEVDTWNGRPMKASTATLAEFVLARIAEDQEAAEREAPDPSDPEDVSAWDQHGEFTNRFFEGDHVRRWSPMRVLAECEAKRRIVELHPCDGNHCCSDPEDPGYGERMYFGDEPCPTMLALTLPYADHPDYHEEWRA